jgi:NADPH-dependent ferric siderophore reductase
MPSAPKWLFDAVELIITKLSSITISHIELLSPSLKKIRFMGDFSRIDFPVGAYIDFRVNMNDARRYTVSHVTSDKDQLELIVHLHGDGPGRHYMDSLKIGDIIDLNRPRSERSYYARSANRLVIFGDETSLALACAFLPELKRKGHPFLFYLELDDENKYVPERLGLENYTVFQKHGNFQNQQWLDKLSLLDDPAWADAHFVLTGNVKSAQAFKRAIKSRTNGKTFLHGYWLEGKKGL